MCWNFILQFTRSNQRYSWGEPSAKRPKLDIIGFRNVTTSDDVIYFSDDLPDLEDESRSRSHDKTDGDVEIIIEDDSEIHVQVINDFDSEREELEEEYSATETLKEEEKEMRANVKQNDQSVETGQVLEIFTPEAKFKLQNILKNVSW